MGLTVALLIVTAIILLSVIKRNPQESSPTSPPTLVAETVMNTVVPNTAPRTIVGDMPETVDLQDDIDRWYVERATEIEAMPIPDDEKDAKLRVLEDTYKQRKASS